MCTSWYPALQCKLFDTLVLPILSYGCEVWGVDTNCGAAAEALHRDFLRRLLGVRKSTANHMVLAELGRFPLQVHFWQQILRYGQAGPGARVSGAVARPGARRPPRSNRPSSFRERKGARESGKRNEERRAAASADGLASSCQTSGKSPTATLSFAIGQL